MGLKDFHAYMPMHKFMFAPTARFVAREQRQRPLAAGPLVKRRQPVLDNKGKPIKMPANRWLDQNRPVEQMTWAPGEPHDHRGPADRGRRLDRARRRALFNLYRPPMPITGDAARGRAVARPRPQVYPRRRRAHHPLARAPGAAAGGEDQSRAVLGGLQGIGKDTLLEPVKRAVGPWNFQESRRSRCSAASTAF